MKPLRKSLHTVRKHKSPWSKSQYSFNDESLQYTHNDSFSTPYQTLERYDMNNDEWKYVDMLHEPKVSVGLIKYSMEKFFQRWEEIHDRHAQHLNQVQWLLNHSPCG